MTDREILAQLKKSYENLQDIREGCSDYCNDQLSDTMIDCLESAIDQIRNTYYDFYESLDNTTVTINKEDIGDYINNMRNKNLFDMSVYAKMLNQNKKLFNDVYKLKIDKDITGNYEIINNDGTSEYVGIDVLCNYEWYNDTDYLNENINKEEDYEM